MSAEPDAADVPVHESTGAAAPELPPPDEELDEELPVPEIATLLGSGPSLKGGVGSLEKAASCVGAGAAAALLVVSSADIILGSIIIYNALTFGNKNVSSRRPAHFRCEHRP